MIKQLFFVSLLTIFASSAYAAWWDCKVSVEKKGFFGYKSHYGDVSREVSAERRSQALIKATEPGFFFVPGWVGSSEYVCSSSSTEHDGEPCKWRFTGRGKCTKQ